MDHDMVLEGKVVTDSGVVETEVGVTDGLIAKIGRGLRGDRRISAGRCLIFPGFIDVHVHLREPGWEYKEDFRTGTAAAAHGGVTTVVDMPNNPSPTTTRAALDLKSRLATEKSLVDVMFLGGVADGSLERLAELAEGVRGYKVYLSETTGSAGFPPRRLPAALKAVARTGRPVSLHCEDQEMIDRRKAKLQGVDRPDVSCDLRPPEAEAESVRQVVASLGTAPATRANVCHASAEGTLAIVRDARARGLRLDCEATLHHLFFNRGAMMENRMLRTNPPLRSESDRSALEAALKDGTVSFLVTDHAPHTEAEKRESGLPGVPGLDDFGHVASWLLRARGVDASALERAAASNPAKFLGLRDRGEVAVGRRADFCVLDIRSEERVRAEGLRTKCGWSPYEGVEFPGRVRWTVRGGEVLLDDYELVT